MFDANTPSRRTFMSGIGGAALGMPALKSSRRNDDVSKVYRLQGKPNTPISQKRINKLKKEISAKYEDWRVKDRPLALGLPEGGNPIEFTVYIDSNGIVRQYCGDASTKKSAKNIRKQGEQKKETFESMKSEDHAEKVISKQSSLNSTEAAQQAANDVTINGFNYLNDGLRASESDPEGRVENVYYLYSLKEEIDPKADRDMVAIRQDYTQKPGADIERFDEDWTNYEGEAYHDWGLGYSNPEIYDHEPEGGGTSNITLGAGISGASIQYSFDTSVDINDEKVSSADRAEWWHDIGVQGFPGQLREPITYTTSTLGRLDEVCDGENFANVYAYGRFYRHGSKKGVDANWKLWYEGC